LGGPYRRYGMEYEAGMKLCEKEMQKNPDFKNVMQQLDEYVSTTTKLTFASYYITPIQRVPRYVILLRDLIKSTSERHKGNSIIVYYRTIVATILFYFLNETHSNCSICIDVFRS
jgi:hypothetical protein